MRARLGRMLAAGCVLSMSLATAATAAPGDVSRITLGSGDVEPNDGALNLDITGATGGPLAPQVVFQTDATNYLNPAEPGPDVDIFGRTFVVAPSIFFWSQSHDENPGNGTFGSGNPSIATAGDQVAFDSDSTNLVVAADTNGNRDVFVRDESTDTTVRASVDSLGTEATGGDSTNPSIDDDGSIVYFQSDATNLVAGDSNGQTDVFRHNTLGPATERVSVTDGGGLQATGGASRNPSQSVNTDDVAFESDATNLGGTGGTDVFVRDPSAGTTTLISVGAGTGEDSYNPSISQEGDVVAFLSEAELAPGGVSGGVGAYMHTWRGAGSPSTERADLTYDGSPSEGVAAGPFVVGWPLDGSHTYNRRFVAFSSYEDSLVPNDTNGVRDVFLRDLVEDRTIRVSVRGDGSQTSRDSAYGVISGGAPPTYVAFSSKDDQIVPGDSPDITETHVDAFVIEPEWTRPETTIAVPAPLETTDSKITTSFTSSEAASTFQCRINGGGYVPCTSPYTTPDLPLGVHNIEIRAVDRFGNVDDSTAVTSVLVKAPPAGPSQQDQVPAPEFRQSFNLEPVSGEVFVILPDGRRFRLQDLTSIPNGSLVDTRNGKVRLIVENAQGELESSVWSQGLFRIVQLASGITDCRLAGPLQNVGASIASAASPRAHAAAKRRRLWGNGKGKFRTKGRFGSATVRGTRWLTEDRPKGTLVLVRRGSVRVRDFVRKKTIVVKRGERYFARKRQPRQSRR